MGVDTVFSIHVGKLAVFLDIYRKYHKIFVKNNILFFITVQTKKNKKIIETILPDSIVTLIENKGCDIGGLLNNLIKILNHEKYEEFKYLYVIHTKSLQDWRDKLLHYYQYQLLHHQYYNIAFQRNIPMHVSYEVHHLFYIHFQVLGIHFLDLSS